MSSCCWQRVSRQDGVTLMELLVSLIIMSVITGPSAAWRLVRAAGLLWLHDHQRPGARDAQDAMATMTRELRDMLPQASGQPLYGQPTILRQAQLRSTSRRPTSTPA